MKIFYIANIRLPTEKAHGIQIMKMCEAFSRAGIEVTLVVPRRLNPIKKSAFSYYHVSDLFRIQRLPVIDFIAIDWLLGPLAFWLEQFFFSVAARWFLRAVNVKEVIVYTRDLFLARVFSGSGKRVVLEAHEFPRHPRLYRKNWRGLDRIIVLNKYLQDCFVREGVPREKIMIAADGVDLSQFSPRISMGKARESLALPLDKKIVLYTGHLYGWKGARILAEAARELPKEFLTIFVGGTEKDVSRFRRAYSAIPNLLILGHQAYERIPIWLQAADILVLPNTHDAAISTHYTSPLKLFEYMAAEKPIIASDLPSIREVVNNENAVLVKSNDSHLLAEAIKKLSVDKRLSLQIATQAGLEVKKYSWEKRAKAIIAFINQS